MMPMKVPLPTIHEKSVAAFSEQSRWPTLLGRHVGAEDDKSMENKVRLYQHEKLQQAQCAQRQMEQLQLQAHYQYQLQQQAHRQHVGLQQHYRAQGRAALATTRLIERGVDPAVARAIVAGQAGALAVGHSNVAQLEPAVSTLSVLADMPTLALSELLPR